MQSDHIFCTDVDVANKDEWAVSALQLRDLTKQPNFPKEFDWPTSPACK